MTPRLVQITLDEEEFLALFNSAALGLCVIQAAPIIVVQDKKEMLLATDTATAALDMLGSERWNRLLERTRKLAEAAWDLDSEWK